MNKTQLKIDLRNLEPNKVIPDEKLEGALRLAGYELAHLIDIPELQASDDFDVVSGTANYDLGLTGAGLDRITVAHFVTGTTEGLLEEVDIRTFDKGYRGEGTTGTPYMFCYHGGEMWLYYIPDTSGTVYYRYQTPYENLEMLGDNYYPLIYTLARRNLSDPSEGGEANEWMVWDREAKLLIKTFKGRVSPYKPAFEITSYRAQRQIELNNLY